MEKTSPNGGIIASDVSKGVVCTRISKISDSSTLPPEVYQTLKAKKGNIDDKVTVVWCVGEENTDKKMDPTSIESHRADRKRRRKVAIISCAVLLVFAGIHIAQATMAYKMVTNINAGAFWATTVLLFGGLISLLGVYNKKEGLLWMSRGLTLILVGIVLALIGAIVDGVTAAAISEIDFDKCSYTDMGKADCNDGGIQCNTTILSHINSCYCCYVASLRTGDCKFKSVSLAEMPTHFGGVKSCRQVSFMYVNLLWGSVAFSVISAIIAVIVAALVGGYKTMVTTSAIVYTTSAARPSGPITTTYAFPSTSASATATGTPATTATGTLPPARPPPPNTAGANSTATISTTTTTSPVYAPVVQVVMPQREEMQRIAPTRKYPVQQIVYPPPPPRPSAPPQLSKISAAPPAYRT